VSHRVRVDVGSCPKEANCSDGARGGVSGARRWINGAGGGRPPIELGFWSGDDKGGALVET
jgi:hypothetical protein